MNQAASQTVPNAGGRRAALPVVGVLLLLALVFLLPRRDSVAEPGPVRGGLPPLPALELLEPPAWARQRGVDEVVRNLDRIDWGGHQAVQVSRDVLGLYAGRLGPEIVSRLRSLGDRGPVLASKLIPLLAAEDERTPGLVDELLNRALSQSALESKAALRVLAEIEDPLALDGIVPRLLDPASDVRTHARAALAMRARNGDIEAQNLITSELELTLAEPDPAYLAVLTEFEPDERLDRILRDLADAFDPATRLVALGTLLRRDDAAAIATFESLIVHDDYETRINALRAVVIANRVVGTPTEHWDRIAMSGTRLELLPLVRMLALAVAEGHPEAPRALAMLEHFASDVTRAVTSEATELLYGQRHPWAVDRTRHDVQHAIGAALTVAVDRVVAGPRDLVPDFVELALTRLEDPELREAERMLLCRLLVAVAPERAAEHVVSLALQREPISIDGAISAAGMLTELGDVGLRRLEQELDTDEGAVVFLRVAGTLGSGAALDGLRRLLLDSRTPYPIRMEALDCVGRLREGPRAELLREVSAHWNDPALERRAFLIFWNYL